MNSSTIHTASNEIEISLTPFFVSVDQATEIISQYVNRIISGIGIISNTILFSVLLRKRLKFKVYNYLWARKFCHILICLLALFYVKGPEPGKEYMLSELIHRIIIDHGQNILFLASLYSDVLAITYRLLILKNKKNAALAKLSKLSNLVICFTVAFFVELPCFLIYHVAHSETENYYCLKLRINSTAYLKIYFLGVFSIVSVIPLTILIVLTVYLILKFQKLSSASNITEEKKATLKFVQVALILTTICTLTKMIDMVGSLFIKSFRLDVFSYFKDIKILIQFEEAISLALLVCVYIFESFFYIFKDRHILKVIIFE